MPVWTGVGYLLDDPPEGQLWQDQRGQGHARR